MQEEKIKMMEQLDEKSVVELHTEFHFKKVIFFYWQFASTMGQEPWVELATLEVILIQTKTEKRMNESS